MSTCGPGARIDTAGVVLCGDCGCSGGVVGEVLDGESDGTAL